MRWYKHYTDASRGTAFTALRDKGFSKAEAYGLYFLLVDYLASDWDGCSEPTFEVNASDLASFLGQKPFKTRIFLEHLQNQNRIFYEWSGTILRIKFAKLSEILHRDAFPSGQRKKIGRTAGRTKNKIKNKKEIIKEEELYSPNDLVTEPPLEASPPATVITHPAAVQDGRLRFQLDELFKLYPRNEGRSLALQLMAQVVVSEEIRAQVETAIRRYRRHVEEKGFEFKYQKTFKEWWKEWPDWLDPQNGTTTVEAKQEKSLIMQMIERGELG